MEKQEKAQIVDDLKGRMLKAASVVLADFRGLDVETVNSLRRDFRASSCEYRVVKNTLLRRVVDGTPLEGLKKFFDGPTAVAFSLEDPTAAAKVAARWAKDAEAFVIKGGFVEGRVLDLSAVEALAKLPGKDQLRSMLLATMQAGPQKFLQLLQAAPQNFLYLLGARERAAGETK